MRARDHRRVHQRIGGDDGRTAAESERACSNQPSGRASRRQRTRQFRLGVACGGQRVGLERTQQRLRPDRATGAPPPSPLRRRSRAPWPIVSLISMFSAWPLRCTKRDDGFEARYRLAGKAPAVPATGVVRDSSLHGRSRRCRALASCDRACRRQRKGTPSELSLTSHSKARYPWARRRESAASVFSGASLPAPRAIHSGWGQEGHRFCLPSYRAPGAHILACVCGSNQCRLLRGGEQRHRRAGARRRQRCRRCAA